MFRFNLPRYMYDRRHYYVPYKECYGYRCIPYSNYINSNIARTNQSIYNSGYLTDVFQNSNIWQSRSGVCTAPMSSVGIGTTFREPSEDELIVLPVVGVGTTGDPIILPGPGPITEPFVTKDGPTLTFNL